MDERDDDHALIAACREGDTQAFGVLVRRYQDRLYPTLARMTGSADDALDLLQDAFLKAYRKLGDFHGDSSFYTWIYRIAVNLALSERRKPAHRRRWVGLDRRGPDAIDPPDDPSRTDPGRSLDQDERDQLIQKALDRLSPDYRTIVVMKDIDGLRYEEIAETLSIPVGTVRSRLHRARGELRDLLRGVLDLDLDPLP
jgi:RNA polymerase sigma-70 factor (ECF subfamily)